MKLTGVGILATFDGPARAVRCAAAVLQAAKTQGVTLRAGLHTGEIELRPSDVTGVAVHIASRITNLAGPNEILVSRTVIDLTAGSGLEFEPRGDHETQRSTWHLARLRRDTSPLTAHRTADRRSRIASLGQRGSRVPCGGGRIA